MPLGVARSGHHLYYGLDHGFLLHGPVWLKHAVVRLWNWASCPLFGHDHLVQEKPGGPVECVSCMREVPDPGPEGVVIREWKIREEIHKEARDD